MLNEDAQEHPLRRQLTAKAPELAPIFRQTRERDGVVVVGGGHSRSGPGSKRVHRGAELQSTGTGCAGLVSADECECVCVCVFFLCVSGGCPFSHNLMGTRSKTIDPILVVFLTFLPSARQHSGHTWVKYYHRGGRGEQLKATAATNAHAHTREMSGYLLWYRARAEMPQQYNYGLFSTQNSPV